MLSHSRLENVVRLAFKVERIRNVGIIAHVDHGKTTLTDRLLEGSGIISEKTAGKTLLLDYENVEKERRMTVKAAVATIPCRFNNKDFILNLVDTPGHIDFSGHVARSMRAIDGAICVVDVVEGVMAQTQLVTMQALKEIVKPALFINKVDRLIKELRLDIEDIRERIEGIIESYNAVLERYSRKTPLSSWRVSFENGSVAIGSALHGWALTIENLRNGLKFKDIVSNYWKDRVELLKAQAPIHRAIWHMIFNHIPHPKDAQTLRIPYIWHGNIESPVGIALKSCSSKGPEVANVINATLDERGKVIYYVRVFSGKLRAGDVLHAVNRNVNVRIGRLSIVIGNRFYSVKELPAGNIAAVTLTGRIKVGETLTTKFKELMQPFEEFPYLAEPVVAVSVEPERMRDIHRLEELLYQIASIEPGIWYKIDKETGQIVLAGTGELQLEIAAWRLRESGVEVLFEKPEVVYKETLKRDLTIDVESPNGANKFKFKLLRWKNDKITLEEVSKSIKKVFGVSADIWFIDNTNMNYIANILVENKVLEAERKGIIEGLKSALRNGYIIKEQVRGCGFIIVEAHLSPNPKLRGYQQMFLAAYSCIRKAGEKSALTVVEPLYCVEIMVEYGLENAVLSHRKRRGFRLRQTFDTGFFRVIRGVIPVARTFNLTRELRSITGGRVLYQTSFAGWREVENKLLERLVAKIREEKGLPPLALGLG